MIERTDVEAAGVVDAAGVEVAVLDIDGVIVSVNGAWDQFREANGGDPERTGVGASYLAACEAAGDEPGAAEVAAAIRRALAGDLASAEVIEISCHSPAEHRWFDVSVSGRTDSDGNSVGATVALSQLRKPAEPDATTASSDVTVEFQEASVVCPLSDIPEADGAVAWAMVEASPDALVMTDEHGVIELVNGQAEVLFGYDRGDLLGRPVEILLPERLAQVHTAHRTRFRVAPEVRAMGSGMDLRGRRADGSEIPVEVSLSPLLVQGELRVIAAVRDISARVAADADARRIRNGVDLIRDGVYMFPYNSLAFEYVNEGAAAQTDYSVQDLLGGMTPLHVAPEFTYDQFKALLAPLVHGSTDSLQFETIMRTRSGADIPVEVVMDYPQVTDDEEPVIVAVVRDITDRIKAEQEALIIQHSVNSVSDAVFVCDEKTLEFVHVNQGAVDLHGYSRAELLAGMTPADLAPGLSLEQLTAAVRGLESFPEANAQLIADGVSKNGDVLTVDVRINWPAPSSPLAPRPVVAVVRDISAEVVADAARRRQEALVAALSEVRLTMLQGASRAQGLRHICALVQTTLDAAVALIVTPHRIG